MEEIQTDWNDNDSICSILFDVEFKNEQQRILDSIDIKQIIYRGVDVIDLFSDKEIAEQWLYATDNYDDWEYPFSFNIFVQGREYKG